MKSKLIILSIFASLMFFNFGFLTNPASAQTAISEIVAQTGQQADSLSPSQFRRFLMNNTSVQLDPPTISQNGSILFKASLQGSGAYGSTDDGIWLYSDNDITRVLRQGDPAYGLSGAFFWYNGASDSNLHHLNYQSDLVGFNTNMSGVGILGGVNDGAFFTISDVGNDGAMVLRQQGSLPGLEAGVYVKSLSSSVVASADSPNLYAISIRLCNLSTCSSESDAVYAPNSSPGIRMRTSTTAPGTVGALLSSFETFKSGAGNLIYTGLLTGGDVFSEVVGGNTITNNKALWKDTGTGLPQLIARTAQPVTADPMGPVIGTIETGTRAPVENSSGDVFFSGNRLNRSTGAFLGNSLFKASSGSVSAVISNGNPITGLSNVNFSSVFNSVNTHAIWPTNNGDVILLAQLQGSGVTTSNSNAIIKISPNGQSTILARGAGQVPGAPVGQTYLNSTVTDALRVAPSGKYAFAARLQGPGTSSANYNAIVTGDENSQTIAFRKSETVIDGYFISRILGSNSIENAKEFQINNQGHILVMADMVEVGDPWLTNRRAILGYTPGYGPQIVAIAGRPIQTSQGPTSNIQSFKFDPAQALNESGEVTYAFILNGGIEGVAKTTLLTSSTPACPADFDSNGSAEVADIFAFLSAWFAQNSSADFDENGQVQVNDIFAFLSAWFAGC